MRAVIQRVQSASVTVNGVRISTIGKGLCVLVGLTTKDAKEDMEYIVKKILNMRLFDDVSGTSWKQSVKESDLEILCVSQFTLYGNCNKGSKPDFHASMKADQARIMYAEFLEKLKTGYKPEKIKDGEFQAMMLVDIANDGPVTLILDSQIRRRIEE